MSRQVGLYRIMCRDEVPELRTVETRNGESSVLNLNLVAYSTPDGQASPWIKLTLWGNQAERYAPLIEHNHACFVDGDLLYDGYTVEAFDAAGEKKTINRISPTFKRLQEFRLVSVVKLNREESESSAPSSVASSAALAASNASANAAYDEMPF